MKGADAKTGNLASWGCIPQPAPTPYPLITLWGSLFCVLCSLLPIPCSLFWALCSLFPVPYSLFPRKGFVSRSSPITVAGPCPGKTGVSSGKISSRS